jgi:hypothetical protein
MEVPWGSLDGKVTPGRNNKAELSGKLQDCFTWTQYVVWQVGLVKLVKKSTNGNAFTKCIIIGYQLSTQAIGTQLRGCYAFHKEGKRANCFPNYQTAHEPFTMAM